ncbi:elongation factor P 5-aminopentanone reductase [Lachnobacterium bovis]|uniref:3-oxoacyl-[acyl-carrier protein] reductase n=1 Tax=Lachnobacterium bovis TaxID=140626 RepID=A0A1H9R2E7_9FIRM|nr:SDR family NAD(P)-dependent oxidoreductase [Lachnobacterium bovis]SER66882.1 3-oxoacyl-[acyl-carrier protein] reductase [Lachnobacterium bovis]
MSKIALITGASRGIGAALAREFAQTGYNLSLCCRNSKEDLFALKKQLEETYHVEVMTSIGDIGEFSFVENMISETLQHFGHINVLVNNAGISHIGLLSDMSVEEWNTILNINLSSAFYTSKLVIPNMLKLGSGKIINISSVWGNVGASCEVAYSACKGGINSFTKALGKELAPSNIQVNAIACGCIDTSMNACFSEEERQELADEIPAGRFGQPEEVAKLALQLVDGNNYLTSQIITLDGGWI